MNLFACLNKCVSASLFFTLLIGVYASFSSAQTPEEKGFMIAARSDRSDRGFGDSYAELEMVLRNKAGQESRRTLTIKTLEVADEDVGDKSLIVFASPADISGTALLSHANILEPDEQWLYLPSLKRTKRISSVNKSGPFVGSEFAFEDFTALELKKYTYAFLRREKIDGFDCDVIAQHPRYEYSGYSKQIAWIDREVHQVRKVEFYDRKGDLLKILRLADYQLYQERYWRPHTLEMVNQQTGKSTDMLYSRYRFNNRYSDMDFEKGALRKLR